MQTMWGWNLSLEDPGYSDLPTSLTAASRHIRRKRCPKTLIRSMFPGTAW
jgi:hypothetical protein